MALLYNPREMPDSELRATFVARQPLIEDLLTTIEGQPEGAGVQHAILVAPRGMGKTTILLMLEIGLRDRGMDKQWQVVAFPEESYGVYDLADFWMQAARLLASATGDDALLLSAEKLRDRKHDKDNLRGGLYALLKDWSRAHSRRLLLLVDNFDMILGQINDDEENASLRNALMNDGTIMLVGGATSFFREARSYDQPLYHFFKRYDLFPLSPEEIEELLLRRSAEDGRPDFEETLRTNRARVRALEYFTGGSPRLVLMLYRILTTSDLKEIRLGLEKLLDDVTPYYKARVEVLPAQQRKILDEVARASIRTRQGVTPTALAGAIRMSPNQVSSQLKRLADSGYVSPVRLRGRESYYTLSEPLYAVWHQMRFGIEARRRMEWLVEFLRIYYSSEELRLQNQRLDVLFRERLSSGDLKRAQEVVELRWYVTDALATDTAAAGTFEGVADNYYSLTRAALEHGDPLTALEQVNQGLLACSDDARLWDKRGVALLDLGRYEEALASFDKALALDTQSVSALENRGVALGNLGRHEEALASFDKALALDPQMVSAWVNRGAVLGNLGRYEEELASYDKALALDPQTVSAWVNRGVVVGNLGRHEEALSSFDEALTVEQQNVSAWANRGLALWNLGRHEEALASFDEALAREPQSVSAWYGRGVALEDLGRHGEALASFDKTLDLEPLGVSTWVNRGVVVGNLGRHEEALSCYDKALALDPLKVSAWDYRGVALGNLAQHEEALASHDKALALDPLRVSAWYNRGIALSNLGRHEDALESYDRALARGPQSVSAWENRGNALSKLGRHEEALASYDKALALGPQSVLASYNRGVVLAHLERYEEALASYDKALALDPQRISAWYNRGVALRTLGRYEEALASFDKALALDPQTVSAWENRGVALGNLGRHEEELASFDNALALDPSYSVASVGRILSFYSLARFGEALAESEKLLKQLPADSNLMFSAARVACLSSLKMGEEERARRYWTTVLQTGSAIGDGAQKRLLPILLDAAKLGHLEFAREAIRSSGLEEQMLPLARALDYIATGDEGLIEKLSPEIKPIVRQLVEDLQPKKKAISSRSKPTSKTARKLRSRRHQPAR